MQKVLIISYFFPPCNLTAAERISTLAKHLNKFGYYPIVITRRWDNRIKNMIDISAPTPTEILHIKNEFFEVYQIPYIPNLRDRIYTKYGDTKFTLFRKALSLIEFSMQRYFNYLIPYGNMFDFAEKFMAKNTDIKKAIVSGNPFITFKFCYLLNLKYKTKWIADYRDAWTTSEIDEFSRAGIMFKLLRKLDKKSELKWVSTASAVTSVSEPLVSGISKFVGKPSKWISNGFEIGEFDNYINLKPFEKFTVTHVGQLYFGQDISMFCEAFKKFIDKNNITNAKLLFPGLAFNKSQEARIVELMSGYEAYYECTERTEKEKILEIEARSHLLLYPAWKGFKGIIASKIYEYISSGTHTLVAPSDNGEVEKIINTSGCGTCTNSVEETVAFLEKTHQLFEQGIKLKADLTGEKAMFFSREHQAKRMAELLDEI